MGYKLPNSLRHSLRKPLGKLFQGDEDKLTSEAIIYIKKHNPPLTVSIGDYCTKKLLDHNFLPNIIIFDGKTQRLTNVELYLGDYTIKDAINPPEWISDKASKILENTITFSTANNCRVAVRIQGEEDLLVIPTILVLPVGSIVVYGQPPFNKDDQGGLVIINVQPELKSRIKLLLTKFDYHEELLNGNFNNKRDL
ncbi:MAG: GTP-dependent dephospho-CoA kinase family protein [Candidatus Hodarchaeales archaeon]